MTVFCDEKKPLYLYSQEEWEILRKKVGFWMEKEGWTFKLHHLVTVNDYTSLPGQSPKKVPSKVRTTSLKGFRLWNPISGIFTSKSNKEKQNIPVYQTKAFSHTNGLIFGAPLDRQSQIRIPMSSSFQDSDIYPVGTVEIPLFLYKCVEFFKLQRNMEVEGIFRLPTSQHLLQQAIMNIEQQQTCQGTFELDYFNPRLVANLLKRYLREMKEPLITSELYPLFMATVDMSSDFDKFKCIQLLLLCLPKQHLAMLDVLIQFIQTMAQYESKHKMTTKNMTMMLAPNIIRPTDKYYLDDPKESVKSIALLEFMVEKWQRKLCLLRTSSCWAFLNEIEEEHPKDTTISLETKEKKVEVVTSVKSIDPFQQEEEAHCISLRKEIDKLLKSLEVASMNNQILEKDNQLLRKDIQRYKAILDSKLSRKITMTSYQLGKVNELKKKFEK